MGTHCSCNVNPKKCPKLVKIYFILTIDTHTCSHAKINKHTNWDLNESYQLIELIIVPKLNTKTTIKCTGKTV